MSSPVRRRSIQAAIVSHGLLAAWLLVNGVAHTVSILAKANAGTLRAAASVSGLTMVGAGLTVAGLLVAMSTRALFRNRASTRSASLWGAWGSLAAVAAVLTAVGVAYGAGTLSGSLLWTSADAAVLAIATLQPPGRDPQRPRPRTIQRGAAES
jgi:hypothetical protein